MIIERNYENERRIASYDIIGVTCADMYKMTQVYDRVMSIIGNHLDKKAEKKEYLSDDDLYDIVSILDIITENNRTSIKKSVFDERKEKLIMMHKKLLEAPVEDDDMEYKPD